MITTKEFWKNFWGNKTREIGGTMGNFGGFGGGFNMQNLMKQAQKMQEDLAKAQEELEDEIINITVGGGMVSVSMNGKKVVQKITLKKEAVDPDDIEMLEDLIKAGVNEAMIKVDELVAEKMPNGLNGLV